eukprot:gb/GFBE01051306.1/.p1 GENE.gb/GFBE01051306.1/~~gb/GFBE01051306.1/.p1  ORF type:complete len:178 (+),score=19.53 gb/GFBE01051306.1/:1-534(+)
MNLIGLAAHLRNRPLPTVEISDDDSDSGAPVFTSEAQDRPAATPPRPTGRRRSLRGRRAAQAAPAEEDSSSDDEERSSPAGDVQPRPETHVLLELLTDQDYFHASPTLRGERQRAKGRLLTAERHAELRLLRRNGWYVCCVPEHRWQLGTDGDLEAASQANREMIFEIVANLEGTAR